MGRWGEELGRGKTVKPTSHSLVALHKGGAGGLLLVRVRDERFTKLPGCDDCTGVGHDKNLVVVVVVVAWAGPGT